jgi:glycosyltransferase involved in cell wall biosynthesis
VPPAEIVVVDDGSKDRSREVIERYGERVRLIAQANAGQVAATNAGVAASTGDLVFILDADDLLHKEAIAEVLRRLRPDCAKCQFDLDIIDENSRDLGRRFCNFDGSYDEAAVREDFRRYALYKTPVMSGNAFSRWFLDKVLPFKDLRVPPDGELNAVAPLYGDVITIPRVLGSYRLHGANSDNQGGGGPGDPARFVKSIERRYLEIDRLRDHAQRVGHTLPDGNLLDDDLVFLNYRLMLKKVGLDYKYAERDSALSLAARVWRVLATSRQSAKVKLAHALWTLILLIAPRDLARKLIHLRLNLAAIKRKLSV